MGGDVSKGGLNMSEYHDRSHSVLSPKHLSVNKQYRRYRGEKNMGYSEMSPICPQSLCFPLGETSSFPRRGSVTRLS